MRAVSKNLAQKKSTVPPYGVDAQQRGVVRSWSGTSPENIPTFSKNIKNHYCPVPCRILAWLMIKVKRKSIMSNSVYSLFALKCEASDIKLRTQLTNYWQSILSCNVLFPRAAHLGAQQQFISPTASTGVLVAWIFSSFLEWLANSGKKEYPCHRISVVFALRGFLPARSPLWTWYFGANSFLGWTGRAANLMRKAFKKGLITLLEPLRTTARDRESGGGRVTRALERNGSIPVAKALTISVEVVDQGASSL